MKRVLYVSDAYPEKRCIIAKVPEAFYEKLDCHPANQPNGWQRFAIRVINHIKYRLGIRNRVWDRSAAIKIPDCKNGDIVHLFNTISSGGGYWCVSFESQTPVCDDLIGRDWERTNRWSWKIGHTAKRMLKACAKPNCLALIAISQSAYHIEEEMINRVCIPKVQKEALMQKLTIIHPPQELMITPEELNAKFTCMEPVRFIIVGHDFFRKGGFEILEVLSELSKKYNIELILISKLYYKDYASASNEQEYNMAKDIIDHSPWIKYYSQLDNDSVLSLMKSAHIGLLPTLADTYGYSVLEMQACGCPVITTDIRALTEINNADCGWLCHIPHNEFGEAIYAVDSVQTKQHTREILRNNLLTTVEAILSNPDVIQEKAVLSVKRISEKHDPAIIAQQLQAIYQRSDT